MNNKIAEFEYISREQFQKDMMLSISSCSYTDGTPLYEKTEQPFTSEEKDRIYENLSLPKRATKGSAGYDICTPVDITLKPGESVKIPTGIRVKMDEDWFLMIVPRSGLGSKFRFQLNNTTGVIDSDYYNSDNEGHIFVPMINDGREGKTLTLKAGTAFAQGIFLQYGITVNDDASEERSGGFGSTDK